MKHSFWKEKSGFTLLELLVVVLIIGILTSVAIPQYSRSVRRAEMLEGMTHGKTIWDSALRFKAANGDTATSFDQLDAGFTGATYDGGSFNDGPFTYILGTDRVTAHSNLSGYDLQMMFPVVSNTGVTADIYCCATNADKTGKWLCASGLEGIINGCK